MTEVKLQDSYDSDSEADEEFEMLEKRLILTRRDDSDSELDSEAVSEGIPSLTHRDDSDSEADLDSTQEEDPDTNEEDMPKLINGYEDFDLEEEEEVFKLTEQPNAKLQTMSSKILISILLKGQANKYKTYLGLLDSGTSTSLAGENLFESSFVTKCEGRGSTWKTQVGNVSTSEVAEVTTLRLP